MPKRPAKRPGAGFRKKKPPKSYRFDSSLSPALDWDGQNPAREEGEAQDAARELARMSKPLRQRLLDPAART